MRPIGSSPSLKPAAGETWYRGNKWPPANKEPPDGTIPADWQQNLNKHFTPVTAATGGAINPTITLPPRAWSTYHFSIVLLTEFVERWAPPTNAQQTLLDATLTYAYTPAEVTTERKNLIDMIEFRPGVMAEALTQADSISRHFRGALSFSKATHPNTVYLEQGALRVAQFVAMYYKNRFQRPRPWQLWPELMPPISVPGHASFPSGHATEAYMLANLLYEIAGPVGPGANVAPSAREITLRVAQRIARNREVLGLHYPSDSVAGEMAAGEALRLFKTCPTVIRLLAAAQAEWAEFKN